MVKGHQKFNNMKLREPTKNSPDLLIVDYSRLESLIDNQSCQKEWDIKMFANQKEKKCCPILFDDTGVENSKLTVIDIQAIGKLPSHNNCTKLHFITRNPFVSRSVKALRVSLTSERQL